MSLRRATPLAVFFVAIAIAIAGCGDGDSSSSDVPLAPTNEWVVESPEDQGMDSAALAEVPAYAFQTGKNTQAVIVVRGGVIVGEWYEEGRDADSYAASWSVGKSFTSALIGIAIEEGLIASVDARMSDFLAEWRGTDKEDMTLRDVLSMASGLRWNESYDPADLGVSDISQMIVAELDHLAYAASRPLEVPPGTRWSYSSGDTMLLSGVLEVATGRTAGEYAREKIFDPIGMRSAEWWLDAAGNTATYCCLDATSREFAKFGLLYLRGGEWNGTQVVPADWVEASTAPSVVPFYGYQWWLDDTPSGHPMYIAIGVDGQYIYVVPALDLVVVRSGRYFKYDGPAQANPSLFARIPAGGLLPGQGTIGPDDWSDDDFIGRVEAAILD